MPKLEASYTNGASKLKYSTKMLKYCIKFCCLTNSQNVQCYQIRHISAAKHVLLLMFGLVKILSQTERLREVLLFHVTCFSAF